MNTYQKDSYCQEVETTVISCDLFDKSKSEYVVVLEDTVLFPEGGGQPSDKGHINDVPISGVKKSCAKVFHYVPNVFSVKEKVIVSLDWRRRFDHMQQHSGQHLITALAEELYQYKTTSWNLGAEISYIELDVPTIKDEEINDLEQKLNEKIRACIPVCTTFHKRGSPELSQLRTRFELPDDENELIRVVSIEGIDNSLCCGTHVKNTSELQVIKLLFVEKGKKSKINLHFIVGNRVTEYLNACVYREKKLNSLLGCKSEELVERIQKLQNSLKANKKSSLLTLKNLATLEKQIFDQMNPKPKYYFLHKKHIEPDFITYFLSEVKNYDNILFFLTVEVSKNDGQFALLGPENIVQKLGPEVCHILDAKGAGKQGKYNGKYKNSPSIHEVDKILKNFLEDEI